MMTAKDIRELRFEKAAWGYRPEDIDEFLGKTMSARIPTIRSSFWRTRCAST